jgi:predicted O-methyltransferase YrrM
MGAADPIKSKVRDYLKERSFYKNLQAEKEALELRIADKELILSYTWFVQPGHFYSPLVHEDEGDFSHLINLWDIKQKEVELPGIKLDKKAQLAMLKQLSSRQKELAQYIGNEEKRFRLDNDQFGHMDMSFLYLMLRHLRPKQIIEVGSGWSSALMLDVNQQFPESAAKLTFVEPYPQRLYTAMRRGDKKYCKVIEKGVQAVDVAQFQTLGKDDLLFIDNSHVSKTGSDVNHLFLDILPRLKKGVVVHIHDIFYPFEYPIQWVIEEKRNWNEIYVLHALLIGSDLFEILFWPSYIRAFNKAAIDKQVPTADDFGGSIWLRKIS